MCFVLNKKEFPNLILNGGGDLCDPTLNGQLLNETNMPTIDVPFWNYDSTFKTRDIIAEDRARFARAWHRQFGEWGVRGGSSSEDAYAAWFNEVKQKYKKHTHRMNLSNHPKYIKEKLTNLNSDQFGFSAFGLKANTKREFKEYLRGYYNKHLY